MAEMERDRRHFLRTAALAAAGWTTGLASAMTLHAAKALAASDRASDPFKRLFPGLRTSSSRLWPRSRSSHPFLTLLHTNDTHARHEPFSTASFRHAGMGGVLRRASLIDRIRAEGHPVLLLDAGDLFQGTPWFDAFDGELEMRMMAALGYDAVALGNHEFDLGTDGFASAAEGSSLPFVCANYDFGSSAMAPFVRPSLVRDIPGGIRIGMFGLGLPLDGNVIPMRHQGVLSRDPFQKARITAEHLRQVAGCDIVIALSHLGYAYGDRRPDDLGLAGSVEGIDLIIGGHTHTFLDVPTLVTDPSGRRIPVFQAGHSGLRLGRIDLHHTNPVVAAPEESAPEESTPPAASAPHKSTPPAASTPLAATAPSRSVFPLKTAAGEMIWISAESLPIDASLDASPQAR